MGIAEAIRNHRIIMCDTAPIIYFIEEHEKCYSHFLKKGDHHV